jgi:sec-independent protein translocase protein TatB
MFDIGWSELVVIGVVALIAIGPKELPGVLRSVGQWMTKIKRMASEFQGQFQEAMREAEMADLKKQAEELNDAARNLTQNFDPFDYVAPTDAKAASTADTTSSAQATSSEPSASLPVPAEQTSTEPVVAHETTPTTPSPDTAAPDTSADTAAPPAGGRAA